MCRLRRQIFAVVLLLMGFACPPAAAGELSYSDVDQGELMRLLMIGEPEEAVREADRMIDGLRPTDNPLTVHLIGELLTFLCRAHNDLGQYPQAEAACLEANAIFEEAEKDSRPGNWHSEDWHIAQALAQLATTYGGTGDAEGALEARVRELKRVDTGRSADPRRVQLLTQIGELQMTLGRFRDAEQTYRQAIAEQAEVWQKDWGALTLPHNNLAMLYRLEERFDPAEIVLKEGLSQKRFANSGKAPFPTMVNIEAMILKHSLGWIYYHQGRYEEARNTAQMSLNFFLGSGPYWLAVDAKILLTRIADSENPGSPEARDYLESAAKAPKADDALSYFFQAVAQYELARHDLLSGNDAAAELLAHEAVATLTWIFGEESYHTARAKVVLAHILQRQKKYKDALTQTQFAYAAQQLRLPPYHSEIGESLALMAELYAAVGDDDNVAAIEELAVAFKAERKRFEAAK